MKKLSIIIPAYNEESTIKEMLKKVDSVKLSLEKEIIFVDDGSNDNTLKFAKENKLKNMIIISKNNNGKGSAIKTGIKKATGNIYIIQDADLEVDPEDYSDLIKPIIDNKTKVVYGSRWLNNNFKAHHKKFLKNARLVTFITNLLFGSNLSDEPTCYKVFHKDLREMILSLEGNKFNWEPEVTAKLIRKGFDIVEVPMNFYPRTSEEGKKINWMDGIHAIFTLFKWRFKSLD
jgi:glycosyltransferase involved in cell wall biosynthesis